MMTKIKCNKCGKCVNLLESIVCVHCLSCNCLKIHRDEPCNTNPEPWPEEPKPKAVNPGEGYRLLKASETLQPGDQYQYGDKWADTGVAGTKVSVMNPMTYRRKIQPAAEVKQPLFEQRALASIKRITDTFGQRGAEYGDTMRDCQWLAIRAVAKSLGVDIPMEKARAIAIGAMFDIKYQRLQGGYKDDTIIDANAYGAFLADEMQELLGGVK